MRRRELLKMMPSVYGHHVHDRIHLIAPELYWDTQLNIPQTACFHLIKYITLFTGIFRIVYCI